ncbi:tetraspanin-19 [Ictalurus punctatus]|uniref:Tetraspanin-19 n=1 Tax=Ictalurus punctatus TaxID=7998 RepID=A0A2D0T654_ICTPU|nr:tetraspanin-19 [Ictalurus punctatus]XP_017350381.1 tetraspanin-19 [Ictalurus punctatus]XP_017350382.1 tetraspanin-19 [Ictalurus punctatus]
MKAEDKLQIGKFLFMLNNSFFIILGISLFGASVWILFDTSNVITVVSNETDVKVVAGGLFIIGLVVVGVSMLGCIGVHLENRCFIAFYMGLLIAIIFGELFISFLLLMKKNQIEKFLTGRVDAIISMYGVNDTQTTGSLLDNVQQSVKCCGRQNASDWETNKFIQVQNTADIYPCSCFNGSCPVILVNEMFGNGTHIYAMGCEEKLKDWFEKNIFVIVGMDLALVIIEILQFILGFLLFRNIGSKIKAHHENLLNATEEIPASSSDLHQNNLESYQSSDQQLHDAYNQEHTGPSYDQYHDPQHQPNNHTYDQRQNNEYNDAGQSFDQYESQLYQQHHGPDLSHHIYKEQHADARYDQYQEQHYQYDHDLHHRQSYNGNYNQSYVHDDYRNNFDCY